MKQINRILTSILLTAPLAVGCSNTTVQTSFQKGSVNTMMSETKPAGSAETTVSAEMMTSPETAQFVLITPEQAKKMLDTDDSVVLVDVREPDEHKEVRIPGSVLLPLGTIGKDAAAVLPDKNVPIIVYCRSGRRSALGAEELVKLGYTNVYDVGGILNWPYDTESGMTSSK